jgi:nitrogen fixation NifU-like protein
MYSPAVLDHFKNPRNAGELPNATATVNASNPVCGDVLQLAARAEGGKLIEVRFKGQGCVTAMACGSVMTEMVKNKSIRDAAAIDAAAIANALGGLPPATVHGSQLAADALHRLLAELK